MGCEDCKNYEPEEKTLQRKKLEAFYKAFDAYCNTTECPDCPLGNHVGSCKVFNIWQNIGRHVRGV